MPDSEGYTNMGCVWLGEEKWDTCPCLWWVRLVLQQHGLGWVEISLAYRFRCMGRRKPTALKSGLK